MDTELDKARAAADGLPPIAKAMVDAVAPVIRAQKKRIDALERRVAEAEAKALRYGGIYSRGITYAPNTLCTADGALWLSIRSTIGEKPGSGDACPWVLIQKAHR